MRWVRIVLVLALLSGIQAYAGILVVYESGVDAYAEAVAGIVAALGTASARLVDLQPRSDLGKSLNGPDVQAVIAVGGRALADVESRTPRVPVIALMVVHAPPRDAGGLIELELPLTVQLETIRSIWPNHTRAGLIRNPAHTKHFPDEIESHAHKAGFSVVVMDCPGPSQLLKTFSAMKGKVDFVLALPDPDLFNAVTIKPLVLASIENGLPIIGYSRAFVRAGAVAGVYPDYSETGKQAAEMARRLIRGEDRWVVEPPRSIRIAVNQRVERLLGIELRPAKTPVEVIR